MSIAIAVCIITFRRPLGLEKLLAHLAKQEGISRDEVLVVVVDNDPEGSARPIAEAARRGGLTIAYAEEPVPGIPRSRNRSVEIALASGAARLCFLDDDEYPSPTWLVRLHGHAAATEAPVVTGPVLPVLPEGAPSYLAGSRIFTPRRYRTGQRRDRAATGNAVVDRRVFEAMEPWFDESMALTGGTDTELFRRAHTAGFAIEWCDEAVVYEDVSRERCSLRWIGRRHFRQSLGSARFGRRYGGGGIAMARILAIGSYRFMLGLALSVLTLGIVPSLRLRLVENLSSGAGLLLGGFGVTLDEYRRADRAAIALERPPAR